MDNIDSANIDSGDNIDTVAKLHNLNHQIVCIHLKKLNNELF
jgi:hypothetical protein